MHNQLRMKHADGKAYEGFISRRIRFIISDDLQVLPASISKTRLLLLRQGLRDNSGVQEWNISVDLQEVLQLLHHSMLSKTPLTDVLLPEHGHHSITRFISFTSPTSNE
ncbi:hypothetical protein PanWU01x14_024660 [Parasponia andersonii]|uniref:Uncharacterized protein n=1 Tax=Parasponia andersonii TaxID=3476 RepID=A0A2P5DWQ4_PARAD|nr:hypothetical protein PanWU01x14_024660 [Parasponia andersonii]